MSQLVDERDLLDGLNFKKGISCITEKLLILIFNICIGLKSTPPGFETGMKFGSEDVDLNLAATLIPQHRHEEVKSAEATSEADMVVDLASLLKEKSILFEWIAEDEPAKESNFGKGKESCFSSSSSVLIQSISFWFSKN